MLRALHIAATGMDAQEKKMDVTSNNLANVNTFGFKKGRAEFQDLLYQTVKAPGTSTGQGTESPSGIQVGLGTRHVSTRRDFATGSFTQTGNNYDLAIEGEGFFRSRSPTARSVLRRAGNFTVDNQGRMVTADGYPLEPQVVLPPDALSMTIAANGIVSVVQAGQTQATELGQIQLARHQPWWPARSGGTCCSRPAPRAAVVGNRATQASARSHKGLSRPATSTSSRRW